MLDFKPPKDSSFCIALVKLLLPLIMKADQHDLGIKIVGDGLERFKSLDGLRTVICPNHAARHDPEIVFAFSKLVNEDFNFLAAREIFEREHGWRGFLMQHLGCYSVVRGACDRESFRMTKSLIVSNKKKLVIFPEGEVSRQNDTLLHLETGVPQLAFWALDELNRQDHLEPVYLLPLVLKYTYSAGIRDQLEKSLYKLEERLGLRGEPEEALYPRLRTISEAILGTLERDYNHSPEPGASINDRIVGLRLAILRNVASYLQMKLPAGQSQLEYVRILRNALDDYIYNIEDETSAYRKKLHDEKTRKIKGFYRDLDRVVNFIAIYDGYLRERLTQERFAEVVDRFELEVFGKCEVKGPRLVYINVGQPIDLLAFYPEYKSDKKLALAKVVAEMNQQMSDMLFSLDNERQAVLID